MPADLAVTACLVAAAEGPAGDSVVRAGAAALVVLGSATACVVALFVVHQRAKRRGVGADDEARRALDARDRAARLADRLARLEDRGRPRSAGEGAGEGAGHQREPGPAPEAGGGPDPAR